MENKQSIMDTILQLSRATRRRHGKGRDVSHGAFKIMQILVDNSALRTSDLAEALDIRPSSLTEKLTRMEQHDLISREKDSNDSRIILVSLTEKGKNLLVTRKKNYEETTEKLQNVLTESEQIEFARISEKLIDFFEKQNPHTHHHRRNDL